MESVVKFLKRLRMDMLGWHYKLLAYNHIPLAGEVLEYANQLLSVIAALEQE